MRFILIYTICSVFYVSCKKEETPASPQAQASNISRLFGTWVPSNAKILNVADDKLLFTPFIDTTMLITMRTDLTYTTIGKDTMGQDKPSNGTFSLQNTNNKLYLVLISSDEKNYQKTCIEEIGETSFVLNYKEDAVNSGESSYAKLTFRKK